MSHNPKKQKYVYRHKSKKKYLLIPVVFVIVVVIGLYLIESSPALVANFADNFLRPVLGNKTTITLESAMLSLSDDLKRLAYGTVSKPNGNIFNPEPTESQKQSIVSVQKNKALAALTKQQALNLEPLNFFQPNLSKLPGEGQWSLVPLQQFNGQPYMAKTFVRPDSARSFAIVALIQMNMHQMQLHSVAGTVYPGAVLGHPGIGKIPTADVIGNKLVAGFNGGFQYIDGHYGMMVNDYTYVPLLDGLGSLTIYKDGTLSIDRYSSKKLSPKPVASIRQNGPLILYKGDVTTDAISGGYQVWGRTTTNSMYTWRSGVGLTKNGNLIYAVGPSLTAATLASALRAGGAVNAIQLDINSFWVRFSTYTPLGNGIYNSESILNTLTNGGKSYLSGYNKDFFYLTAN